MWHTSRGDRTLRGQEAALVRAAIDTMIDALLDHVDDEFEDPSTVGCESGIAVYDAFSATQQIGLLHDVARHLLTETTSALPLSAAVEATVAAIFVEVRDQVAIEIDFCADSGPKQDGATWREIVLTAYQSASNLDEDLSGELIDAPDLECETLKVPSPNCNDIHAWEALVEYLADGILWDRDFEMADSFLDVDPGVSHHRRQLLGIDDDYFTRVAPDPRPDEVFGLISRTRDIVRAKPR